MADSVVALLNRIRSEIYEKVLQGKIQYERDHKTLLKHVPIAEELGDPVIVGRTYNMLGIVEQYMGHVEQAIAYYQQAFDIFATLKDTAFMSRMKNNMGEVYRLNRDYLRAMQFYQEARALLTGSDEETLRSHALIESNMGLAALAQRHIPAAKQHFLTFLELIKEETWLHIDALLEARCGLAEVYLAEGNLTEAWTNANEALHLATGRGHHLMLAEIQFTRAHIAAADPHTLIDADLLYTLGENALEHHSSSINIANTLLYEAIYQQRSGQTARSQRYAQRARTLFEEAQMPERAMVAAEMG